MGQELSQSLSCCSGEKTKDEGDDVKKRLLSIDGCCRPFLHGTTRKLDLREISEMWDTYDTGGRGELDKGDRLELAKGIWRCFEQEMKACEAAMHENVTEHNRHTVSGNAGNFENLKKKFRDARPDGKKGGKNAMLWHGGDGKDLTKAVFEEHIQGTLQGQIAQYLDPFRALTTTASHSR